VFYDNKQSDRQHGFSLIEVMIALLIFMVIMLGLAKGEISALRTQSENSYRDIALSLAENQLNNLKGAQFSLQGTAGALAPANANWIAAPNMTVNMRGATVQFAISTRIVNIAATAIPMIRIDVAVGWNLGNNAAVFAETGMNHQTSLSTIIVQSN
jgi:prepilin-type N-terminal cleavage/methylation domain-containing protein